MSTSIPTGAARTISSILFITQSLASAALIANVTVNPIIGAELSRQPALAGLPGTLLLIGAAAASYPAGRLMQRVGRRPGLALGFLIGMIGMLLSGTAVLIHSFALFLAGLAGIGAARGFIDQSRYAAADAAPPEQRGKAISAVVFAGTVGAVGGPALVAPLGDLVARFGLDRLAGPMLGGALLFALAGLLIALLLYPDPRDIAQALAVASPQASHAPLPIRRFRQILALPAARLALVAMVFGQVIMVLIMTVTSLHMHDHNHGLGAVSLVISAHTLGMFGLSFLTGALADRLGRPATIAFGALLLIAGGLLAPVSLLTPWLALALFLVGLGWNLCYIAGSTLLADTLSLAERGQMQGASDLFVNLASASSSLGSGFILAAFGYGWLCLLGVALSVVPLFLAAWQWLGTPRPVTAKS